MKKKAFVIGWPINHSKSPLLHGFWLDQLSVEGSYEAIAVNADDVKAFLDNVSLKGFAGGNITIPHKEVAFDTVEKRDEAAEMIGAVNTVWIEDNILMGSNTDAYGFAQNLNDFAPEWRNGNTALVIGAGGAARAIIFALIETGYTSIHVTNRTFKRAQVLCDRFGDACRAHEWEGLPELVSAADLIVNTTSLGMASEEADNAYKLPDLGSAKSTAIVTDIVYTPLETGFLKNANLYGLKTVDGLGMLLHQAVPGFERWFGIKPQVTQNLREHILRQT